MSKKGEPKKGTQIRSIYMPEALHEIIRNYAADNNMSVSEAVREFMDVYATGKPLPARKWRTKRVSLWVDVDQFTAFSKRASNEGVTLAAALEAVIDAR